MRALIALTGHEIDHDIAAAAARVLDPARDQILAIHVVHPREVEGTPDRSRIVTTGASTGALPPRVMPALAEDATQAVQRMEDELRDHVEELKRTYLENFTVDFDVIVSDDPADAIVKAVEEHGIGGLAMGTRSKRSRFAAAVLGSAAEEVVRRVSVPVLIVKEGTVASGRPPTS
jgi:nucleotide-binding universal stress UspA family protein